MRKLASGCPCPTSLGWKIEYPVQWNFPDNYTPERSSQLKVTGSQYRQKGIKSIEKDA